MKRNSRKANVVALGAYAALLAAAPAFAQEIGINPNKTADIIELPQWTDIVKLHDGLQSQPQTVDVVTRQSLDARWRSALHEHDALEQEATKFASDYSDLQNEAGKLRIEAAMYSSACTPTHPASDNDECTAIYNRLLRWKKRLQAQVERLDRQKSDHNLETAQWAAQDLIALRTAYRDLTDREPSGLAWVKRFPASGSIDDLASPFRDRVKAFLSAVRAAGGSVQVWVTRRPLERAYLMRYSWLIARGILNPRDVEPMPTVHIDWQHLDGQGHPDTVAALQAARDMVKAYHISMPPPLEISHAQGRAVDMLVSWTRDLLIVDGHGKVVAITSGPRISGSRNFPEGSPERNGNADLLKVAASYGVFRSPSDPTHWSEVAGQ